MDRIALWIAWHLPRSVVMWATIRAGAHATTGPWSSQEVPALRFMDVLKRWETTRSEGGRRPTASRGTDG